MSLSLPAVMLKKPVTSKEAEDGASSSGWVRFGVASMQGWRLRMEDAHLALPDFDPSRQNALFGVFDGHGGGAVAQIVTERLPAILLANANYQAGRYSEALTEVFFKVDEMLDSRPVRMDVVRRAAQYPASEEEDEDDDDEEEARLLAMLAEEGGESELAMEDDLEEDGEDEDGEEFPEEDVDEVNRKLMESNDLWANGMGPDCMGTTAVVALVCKDSRKVFVANAGDSRCILMSGAAVKDLSRDHKPTLKSERLRIRKAGGFVLNPEDGGRVDGNLSLARAFGDFAYKKNKKLPPSEQKITCDPEVLCHELTPADSFLVLGCDGIWEKASSQQVGDFLRPRCTPTNGKSSELSGDCAAFLDGNIAKTPMSEMGLGCDNMTLMSVDLRGRANVSAKLDAEARKCQPSVPKLASTPLSKAAMHRRGSRCRRKPRVWPTAGCSRSYRRRLVLRCQFFQKR